MTMICFVAFLTIAVAARAQSGGSYALTQSVIAAGGGQNSSGGAYSLDGTIGQTDAGANLTGGNFRIRGGFWSFETLAPTAAAVSISGRVTTAAGEGIRNAQIILTDSNGSIRVAQTASFGYFRFDEVTVGQTYVLQISSRRFVFSNPARVLSVRQEITDANFIADN